MIAKENARRRAFGSALATCCLLVFAGDAAYGCAANFSQISGPANVTNIRLRSVSAGASACHSCTANAGNAWNSACAGRANPEFQTAGSGADLTVDVEYRGGNNDGSEPGCSSSKCGCTKLGITGGRISSARVIVWESAAAGQTNCSSSYQGIITHELGHVQGLKDAPACQNRIMGNATGSAAIRSQECDRIDGNFLTLDERFPNDPDNHPCRNPAA